MIKKISVLVCVAMSVTSISLVQAKDKPILLKMPIYYNSNLPGLGSPAKYLEDNAVVLSGGTVKVKMYEPKKLVAPGEILDAVSSGKVQAGYGTPANWGGKIPAARLFSAVPFGPEAPEYLAWIMYGNGAKLHQDLYDKKGYNVKTQICGIIAPETSGWFKKEIKSADDLKGLKMRFFGLGAEVMEKLGVSTVGLPGGEIFPALEKGAIDATEFSMPAVDKRIGVSKIAKYNYYPGWHQQATVMELLINKDTWKKMSKTQQAVMTQLCRAATLDSLALGEAIQAPVMRENEANGVKNIYWSTEMLTLFESKWDEVVIEQAEKDADFAAIWADLSKFRADYLLWETNAFLPRKAN
jgi:TRAP-type mannitol/chloroaromatic compound transport system substrate-binding protein